MTINKETFVSETCKEFKWPYPIPLEERPPPPPLVTKSKNLYLKKAERCDCYAHQSQPNPVVRYSYLLDREKSLCQELTDLKNELEMLTLQLPEELKTKVSTTYQADFKTRKGKEELKDITTFKTVALGDLPSKQCPAAHFRKTPKMIDEWYRSKIGKSEYQDTISAIGQSILQNKDFYKQPKPTSKKRPADTSFF